MVSMRLLFVFSIFNSLNSLRNSVLKLQNSFFSDGNGLKDIKSL